MDDYQAVRELLPAPPLSPEVERAGRERLAAAFAQERRRGRRAARWSALGLALAGAAAAAVVVFTQTVPSGAPATSGTVTQADGKQFLLVAAATVAAMPDEGTWWGSTEVHGRQFHEPGGRYVLQKSETIETWIPADPEGLTWYRQTPHGVKPATPQDEAAWRADGSPTSWTYDRSRTGGLPEEVVRAEPGERRTWSTEDWDFRILTAGKPLTKMSDLPDTPEGLKRLFNADDRTTIDTAARLLFFAPVASETRAAAYRLLASVPGVTAVGQVTDALGRTGQAIEYTSSEFVPPGHAGTTMTRLVIDPVSGKPLSLETRSAADGLLLRYTAIQDSRWAADNPLEKK
ncbi:CU044_5270 family protein [Nonomuraea sp. NPDC047897]|uniref:CU044_5270 family protein n=1 Tax=Nonomuraea sp. NPDC047897 TaxID=3364346 RepID=UPI0037143E82